MHALTKNKTQATSAFAFSTTYRTTHDVMRYFCHMRIDLIQSLQWKGTKPQCPSSIFEMNRAFHTLTNPFQLEKPWVLVPIEMVTKEQKFVHVCLGLREGEHEVSDAFTERGNHYPFPPFVHKIGLLPLWNFLSTTFQIEAIFEIFTIPHRKGQYNVPHMTQTYSNEDD